ncbi:hypothetical protein M917_0575 [Psychrobacter aquaticus CMS 56]|uniref:Uncharacterized protein n=1 Tax=Psychrobacter aquaticus CMS 56 TaxID=1354303 RepID=U4TCX5_9GAMM|nr:hypothetical protein M917_0575 [Psychrobacter aquaticus CMS 56]
MHNVDPFIKSAKGFIVGLIKVIFTYLGLLIPTYKFSR